MRRAVRSAEVLSLVHNAAFWGKFTASVTSSLLMPQVSARGKEGNPPDACSPQVHQADPRLLRMVQSALASLRRLHRRPFLHARQLGG